MAERGADRLDEKAHYNATVFGGLKTGGIGLGSGILAAFAAQRTNFRPFTRLTLPLKAFALTSITTAAFVIGADSASRKYELSKYAVGSGTNLEAKSREDARLEEEAGLTSGKKKRVDTRGMSTRDILVEWGKDHRYGVVLGAWVASMAGSFGYISMTPLSFSQKLVQARMVAQGLTVAVLIASAGLSQIPTAAGGENDEQIKREEREAERFKWKKGSPHELEERGKSRHSEAK